MKVVVMGAGLAGVTTAWELARNGHAVVVIERERQLASAEELRAPEIDLEGLRIRN